MSISMRRDYASAWHFVVRESHRSPSNWIWWYSSEKPGTTDSHRRGKKGRFNSLHCFIAFRTHCIRLLWRFNVFRKFIRKRDNNLCENKRVKNLLFHSRITFQRQRQRIRLDRHDAVAFSTTLSSLSNEHLMFIMRARPNKNRRQFHPNNKHNLLQICTRHNDADYAAAAAAVAAAVCKFSICTTCVDG